MQALDTYRQLHGMHTAPWRGVDENDAGLHGVTLDAL